MIGLAIHTSSPELGLALLELAPESAASTMKSQVWPLGRDLTAYLHTCLQTFMGPHAWSELAYIAVAKGPGGFTGTRIGVVVARTLAQQLAIPLFGISSLDAIAQHHFSIPGSGADQPTQTAVALRAQRGEMFGAVYQRHESDLQVVQPEALYAQTEWESKLAAWPTRHHLIQAEGGQAAAVTGVLSLAQARWLVGDRPHWQTVLPFYGQHPVR
ncbi:MAG: tRNA (adenosine(37)-N6)-threonylcarbamoyltransferase complex dimerization subunit type 1 TsaB [Leptolyngbyaceae cyanobacterium]